MTAVVDASVVLAWLQDEPGADEAEPLLMEGVIGAANWSEVLRKARQHGEPPGTVGRLLASLGLRVEAVTREDAERAADLWQAGSSPRRRTSTATRRCCFAAHGSVKSVGRSWRASSRGRGCRVPVHAPSRSG
jgi:PIN domain nuclease of toxin-antitoxin system